LPVVENKQVQGLITGSEIRLITDANILGIGNWLTTVNFFDDDNHGIQEYEEMLKGTDITTSLYDFTGKLLCTYLDHTNPTGTPASLHVKTNVKYDHTGRLLEIWKTLNDNVSNRALIVKNEYDELGQLKKKELGA
jgi:hypothetical protein